MLYLYQTSNIVAYNDIRFLDFFLQNSLQIGRETRNPILALHYI